MADSPQVDRVRYFGDYLILGEIARGGMGVVYLARQSSLNRDVALKLIKAGTLASRRELELFRWEAEAAAGLSHPRIVRVYEFGEHDGQPFVAMEFIDGSSLAAQVKERAWALTPQNAPTQAKRIARLLIALSDALHHAHQHGVIHRDLKPGNILLNEGGDPFVTDFGLAKLLHHDAAHTRTGQVLGTPAYMAPEQAAGNSKEVTAATDVYGLGAILYALLTEQPPFQGATEQQTLEWVRLREPQAPQSVNPAAPADLATICLKCLEKEPTRRYASALHLQEDLQRWLDGEPILARPASAWERGVKWVRRHPQTAAFLAALVVCLLAGVTGVTWQWRRATAGWAQASTANARLRLQRAEDFFERGDASQALAVLARALRDAPDDRAAEERLVNALHSRGYFIPLTNAPTTAENEAFGFDLDFQTAARIAKRGGIVALATNGENVQVISAGAPDRTLAPPRPGVIRSIALSSDGTLLAAAVDGLGVCLWNLRSAQLNRVLKHPASVEGIDFSPDASLLATGPGDGILRLWNPDTGSLIREARTAGALRSVRFHAKKSFVASGSVNGIVQLWRMEGPTELTPATEPRSVGGAVDDLRFATDAAQLWVRVERVGIQAFAWTKPNSPGHYTANWPTPTLEPITSPLGRASTFFHASGAIMATNLSPDGSRLATASTDRTARLWDVHSCAPLCEPLIHGGPVSSVSFSPDGRHLLTSSADRRLRVWDAASGMPLTDWLSANAAVVGAAFLNDGDTVLSSGGQTWTIHRSSGLAPNGSSDLAETIAGVRFNANGVGESLPHREAAEICRVLLNRVSGQRGAWWPAIESDTETRDSR